MNYDTVPTLCVTVIALFAIQGITIYAVAKLVILGRTLVEKREHEHPSDQRRIVGPWTNQS